MKSIYGDSYLNRAKMLSSINNFMKEKSPSKTTRDRNVPPQVRVKKICSFITSRFYVSM